MKTLRRLAFLALFAAAGTATAGPPAENAPAANVPARNAPRMFTTADLSEMLNGQYKGIESAGDGNAKTYSSPKLTHKLKTGDQTVEWAVQFGLMSRGLRSPVVRIFFPCQKLPAKPDADRLAKLMNQSGGGLGSPAYFMVGGKDADWLYIVGEVTSEGLTGAILKEEVADLFEFAERTMNLWGEDLSKPPAKTEGKSGLTGYWKDVPNGQGRPPVAERAGLLDLVFTDDGKMSATVARRDRETFKEWVTLTGTYTLKGDTLAITPEGSKAAETYTVTVKDGQLTISPDKGDTERTFAKVKTTLHLWK